MLLHVFFWLILLLFGLTALLVPLVYHKFLSSLVPLVNAILLLVFELVQLSPIINRLFNCDGALVARFLWFVTYMYRCMIVLGQVLISSRIKIFSYIISIRTEIYNSVAFTVFVDPHLWDLLNQMLVTSPMIGYWWAQPKY